MLFVSQMLIDWICLFGIFQIKANIMRNSIENVSFNSQKLIDWIFLFGIFQIKANTITI
jgi:hypothetical protein